MAYRLEVICKDRGGTLDNGWRPAIAGTLNQTQFSDGAASTYGRKEAALADLGMVREQRPNAIRILNMKNGEIVYRETVDTQRH